MNDYKPKIKLPYSIQEIEEFAKLSTTEKLERLEELLRLAYQSYPPELIRKIEANLYHKTIHLRE